jgi:Family of unknown function (DUF5681)
MPWSKGISGNPGGRFREKEYTDALRMIGKEEVEHPEDPTKKVRKLRLLAETVFNRALAGESWAVQHISDRLEGKPVPMLEPSTTEGQTLRKLTYEVVHVTQTQEEIDNEDLVVDYHEVKTNNGGHKQIPPPPEAAPTEALKAADGTPEPLKATEPPEPVERPWRPVHQRPARGMRRPTETSWTRR